MNWVLIITYVSSYGGYATTVPMLDKTACAKAAVTIEKRADNSKFVERPDLMCVNSETGEVIAR